jgi:hypothetical protein
MEEAVNMLCCMMRRAGRRMEHRGTVCKKVHYWYDEECQWEKKEPKLTHK